jgi:acyl carrier protein
VDGARSPGERLPIGKPVANTSVVLLGSEGQQSELIGEMGICSPFVAPCYLNDEALTQRAFFAGGRDGIRIYRTGDIGRRRADGLLEFVGRRDSQVKVRGHRTELGEIEAELRALPGVVEAVVELRANDGRDAQLIGYLVCAMDGGAPDRSAVRTALQVRLPAHMIPAALVRLDRLPLTANGKVDRRALPAPVSEDYVRAAFVAPSTQLECVLARLWSDLLRAEKVGVNDDFFELGGHSLLAIRMVILLRDLLAVEFPLQRLFATRTIASLADALLDHGVREERVDAVNRLWNGVREMSAEQSQAELQRLRHATAAAT